MDLMAETKTEDEGKKEMFIKDAFTFASIHQGDGDELGVIARRMYEYVKRQHPKLYKEMRDAGY